MRRFYIISLFLIGYFSITAQEVRFKTSLDTNSILIGEQTKLKLTISYENNENIELLFPIFKDSIVKGIEIISSSKIDTVLSDKNNTKYAEHNQYITITSFDTGFYVIPPIPVVFNKDTLTSDPLLFQVQTMEVDTTKAVFDIKAPIEVPFSITNWLKQNWWWLVIIIIVIILIVLLIKYLIRKKPEIPTPITPQTPYYITMLNQLEELDKNKLWQSGKVKKYHSKLSEILRTYIEKRYNFNALELTTHEIMESIKYQPISSDLQEKLHRTLKLADMVKFAKEVPLANDNNISLIHATEFINQTKPNTIEKNNDSND